MCRNIRYDDFLCLRDLWGGKKRPHFRISSRLPGKASLLSGNAAVLRMHGCTRDARTDRRGSGYRSALTALSTDQVCTEVAAAHCCSAALQAPLV